ncbi:malectin-B-like [Ornithodoros turicata]|uniref:malectin-B-like n=1 Tax=Ornithodoros turicata TaxID=34597 RepID=UPI0031387A26
MPAMFLVIFLIATTSFDPVTSLGEVIYAINAGGEEHVDMHGIKYKRDPLFGKIGTASDYGKLLVIGRSPRSDQILYQTERYHTGSFGYDIPVNKDGDYVLVLKFSEVYFESQGRKVFDVVLNGQHTIVSDLDIFSKVGKGVAYDEHVAFSIKGNKLHINGEESTHDGKIKVEFIKGYKDNPKVNAIYVMRGTLDDLPEPPPSEEPEEEEEEEPVASEPQQMSSQQPRRPSGPRTPNPYTSDDSSALLPIFVAIGAFIPLLFCLCKL